jgi:hypothetical protein
VTTPFAVEALDSRLHLGRLRRTNNTLAILLRLLALQTLCRLTRLLEVRSLVDQEHIVFLLDFHLRSLDHSKQL